MTSPQPPRRMTFCNCRVPTLPMCDGPRMRRLFTFLLLPVVALGGAQLAPTAATAGAASDFALSVNDQIVYPGCSSYGFALDPDLPAAAENGWDLAIEVRGPGGVLVHEDTLSDSGTDVLLDSMSICSDAAGPGVYRITGTGSWYDENYNTAPVSLDASFTLRRPNSITTLSAVKANVRPGSWAKLKTMVLAETRRGPDASMFTTVVLQQRKAKRWVQVKGARVVTDKFGEASFRYRYRGGRVSLRAKASPSEVNGSTSLPVVLR